MNTHPSFSTSSRQVVGVILDTTYGEDVRQLLEPWSEKHGFVFERSQSPLGAVFTFYRGVNRRKFIRHVVRLGKLGSSLALVSETVPKGQPMDSQTAEHVDILAPLAALKPKHVRNDIGPIEDGVGFIRNVRAHLDSATSGLPFILISPPHDSPDRELIEAILAESDDIDVIRVGRKTKTKIRALGYEKFCQGHLLLRIPGHAVKVLPIAPAGEGLREAIRLARASHGLRSGKLIGTNAHVKAGAEPKPYQHSCWTVRAAFLTSWPHHHDALRLPQTAVAPPAACNTHSPALPHDPPTPHRDLSTAVTRPPSQA